MAAASTTVSKAVNDDTKDSEERQLLDELLLRITRVALQPGEDSSVYHRLAAYFKKVAKRQRESVAAAASEDGSPALTPQDATWLLQFTVKEVYVALTSASLLGKSRTLPSFEAHAPILTLQALKAGLILPSGRVVLQSSLTEIIDLSRRVEAGRGMTVTRFGTVRLVVFTAVAVTLLPVIRLAELIEFVATTLSCGEEDPGLCYVAAALMSSILHAWAVLDVPRSAALLELGKRVFTEHCEAASGDANATRSLWGTLSRSMEEGDSPCHGLRSAYVDPVLAAVEESSSTEVPAAAKEADADVTGAEEEEEEEEVKDTIDYEFWNAIACHPRPPTAHQQERQQDSRLGGSGAVDTGSLRVMTYEDDDGDDEEQEGGAVSQS